MPGFFVSYFRVILFNIIVFLLRMRSNFTMLKRLYLCGFPRNPVKSRVCKIYINRFKSCYPHSKTLVFTGFFLFVSYLRVIQFRKTLIYTVVLLLCFFFQNVTVYLLEYRVRTPATALHNVLVRDIHCMK